MWWTSMTRAFPPLALCALIATLVAPVVSAASYDVEVEILGAPFLYFASPGQPLGATVRVTNAGTSDFTATLTPIGLPAGWTFAGGPVTVAAGGTQSAAVTVVPTGSAASATIYVQARVGPNPGGDSDIAPTALQIVVPIVLDLTLDSDFYFPDEDVLGTVSVTYLDGAPVAGRAVSVEGRSQFSFIAPESASGTTGSDGRWQVLFPSDLLGTTAPGSHEVVAEAVHGTFTYQDSETYQVLV